VKCNIFFIILSVSAIVSTVSEIAHGAFHDLGVTGETYPVREPDITAELKAQSIDLDKTRNKTPLKEKLITYQPLELCALPAATKDKTFLVDMNYTLDHDLTDGNGHIIYAKGYSFNPLDIVSLSGGLVIIDGNDPVQVEWFKNSPYFSNHRAKLLITDGFAFELIETLQRPAFYLTNDIAKRLQLTAVPSVVVQKADKMMVREIFLTRQKKDKPDVQK